MLPKKSVTDLIADCKPFQMKSATPALDTAFNTDAVSVFETFELVGFDFGDTAYSEASVF